jgi:hypothetical protein
MEELKKDHSIGAGTGAAAGATAGALVGAAAGPIGAAIGGLIGGIGGAKAGDSLAELVNPTEYDAHWQSEYKSRPYYNKDRDWNDYAPAYGLGYHAKGSNLDRRYEDVDNDLENNWDEAKGDSRLEWEEAKHAVRDGWRYVERKLPGDFDNDGR